MRDTLPLRLAADRYGTAALEFALIAPVMAMLWLGTIEVCHVYKADTQLYNAAEAAANVAANELVSVNGDISANICNAAKDSMWPFATGGKLTLAIASVTNTTTYTQSTSRWFDSNPADFTAATGWTVDWTNQVGVNSSGICTTTGMTATVTTPAVVGTAGTTPPTTYQSLVPNANDSMLIVQAYYSYTFPIAYNFPGSFNLSQTVYTRPRNGGTAPQ